MPQKKIRLHVPREGTIARQAADELGDNYSPGKGSNWFVPSSPKVAKAIRFLRTQGWPIEDRQGAGVRSTPSTGPANHEYRLDPDRASHYEFHV